MFKPNEKGLISRVLSEFTGDVQTIVFAHKILVDMAPNPDKNDVSLSPEESSFLLKIMRAYKTYPVVVAPVLGNVLTILEANIEVPDDSPEENK